MYATRFDGNSLSVAKLATSNGFKFAYAIKDGAEGPNGWRVSISRYLLVFMLLYSSYLSLFLSF
jgi:hypothetical protein